MSTAPIANTSLNQQLHQYFQTRSSDLQQLGGALASGNLAGAQTAFNNITTLGQSGPFANGNAFKINQREQDFTSIGQALQSGDLAGAQQAFGNLVNTFKQNSTQAESTTASAAGSTGPEVVLNLSSASPEQITINVGAPSSGGTEPVSVSTGNQSNPVQQVTLNLNPSSNEQIILNLLGESSSTGGSSSSTSSSAGLSVSA